MTPTRPRVSTTMVSVLMALPDVGSAGHGMLRSRV
jgi:hypothetical protein